MDFKPRNKGAWRAGILAAGLAAVLSGCQSEPGTDTKPVAGPAGEAYASPAEVMFLYDDAGNVPRQVPPAVLDDMRTQLEAQGRQDLVQRLEDHYDFRSGEVRNHLEAEKAERFLKARLPLAEEPKAAAPAGEERPYPEFGIPPELQNHFERRSQTVGAKVSQGGAE